MRTTALVLMILAVAACDKGGGGVEEAKRQAELEDKAKGAASPPAKKLSTPVPGSAKVPCSQLIDPVAFQTALGEKEPLTVQTTAEADAAASCALLRGGKRPTEAEQQGILKTQGRLGVMPGDVLCVVSAFCWTIEDADHFRKKCTEQKPPGKDDDGNGFYSCMTITAAGEDDQQSFKFFDDDTKCLIGVRGGPSMNDNDLIRKCTKTARDSIGPAQISMTPPAAPAPAAPAGSAAQ